MPGDKAPTEWASAVIRGWTDLAELSFVDHRDRPLCGDLRCDARARWVDPDGVGWCYVHRDQGPHGEPPWRTP